MSSIKNTTVVSRVHNILSANGNGEEASRIVKETSTTLLLMLNEEVKKTSNDVFSEYVNALNKKDYKRALELSLLNYNTPFLDYLDPDGEKINEAGDWMEVARETL